MDNIEVLEQGSGWIRVIFFDTGEIRRIALQ